MKKLVAGLRSLFASPASRGSSEDAGRVRAAPSRADLDDDVDEDPPPVEAPGSTLVNVYSTLRALPGIDFPHVLHARRDRTDPELAPHLNGFLGYIHAQAQGQRMTVVRYHLMRHVERVQNHLSLSFEPAQREAFARWAAAANAVAFLRDGTVRDAQGRVLLAPGQGPVDPQAAVPHPADAQARKARTLALLAERGLQVPASMPPVLGEGEYRPRDAAEILGRAQALVVVSERAISLRDQDPLPVALFRQCLPGAFAHLSPDESAFVARDDAAPADLARFGWQCECTHVLLWALGLVDSLPFPSAICVGGEVTRVVLENAERPASSMRPRAASEILDALDLHLRLHWLTTEARLGRRPAVSDVEPGVVMERHRALNWLVRFEDADWDDVDMPT